MLFRSSQTVGYFQGREYVLPDEGSDMKEVSTLGLQRLPVYFRQFKVTPSGRYLIAGSVVTTIPESVTLYVPFYYLFLALSALSVIRLIAELSTSPRVVIERNKGLTKFKWRVGAKHSNSNAKHKTNYPAHASPLPIIVTGADFQWP